MPSRDEVIEQLKASRKTSGLGLLAKLGGLTNRLGELLGEGGGQRGQGERLVRRGRGR